MTDREWIAAWLTTPQNVSTRSIWPRPPERAAVATAATHFVKAAEEMAESIEGEPDAKARDTAVIAAVVDDYVSTISKYIEPTDDDVNEDDEYELDDNAPENLNAMRQIAVAREAAASLTERARRMLEEAGLPEKPEKGATMASPEWQKGWEEQEKRGALANSAAVAGHSAALRWLIEELYENHDPERPELKSAIVLAMWPNEDKLMRLRGSFLTNAGRETLTETVGILMQNTWDIEEHRPAFVTQLADPQWHDGHGQELVSMFPNVGPEADAMYHWDEDDTDNAIMAYRHRGSTHVKLVSEPYSHSIDWREALGHCEALEQEALESRDFEEEDPNTAQAAREMLAMAAANRSLILLGYHDIDHDDLDEAAQSALRRGGAPRAWQLINAIYDGQAQIVYQKAAELGLNQPELTPEQMKAAVTAAQAAGATADAVRHMAATLGLTPEDPASVGIAEAEPIPKPYAQFIISNVFSIHAPRDEEKWQRVVAATGWDHSESEFQRLRRMLS